MSFRLRDDPKRDTVFHLVHDKNLGRIELHAKQEGSEHTYKLLAVNPAGDLTLFSGVDPKLGLSLDANGKLRVTLGDR